MMDGTLSKLFYIVMERAIPEQWNTSRVTPVFKKGDKTLAANYRPVSVVGPIAKLYATCINLELQRQA